MSLTTFSGQTPPWDLGALDGNFATLNSSITTLNANVASNTSAITALQSLGTPVNFGCTATGAFGGNITLSYVTFGPLVWVYTPQNIIGNSSIGNSITFTQFPPAIRTTATQYVAAPTYFLSGNSFGNFFSCQIDPATGIMTAIYGGALPTNTLFGFAKGMMLNYVIQ